MKTIFLLILFLMLVGCASYEETTKRAPVNPAPESLEAKLASINVGHYVDSSDPTIQQFRQLLDSLEGKTHNSHQQIADMSVTAQQMLAKNGIDETLLAVMRATDASIPEGLPPQDYAEIAAAYVTLRVE